MTTDIVYIVSSTRTPIGGFGKSLASQTAVQLGSVAIKGALEKSNIPVEQIDEVIFGNVLSAGLGQNPARQAALNAGIPNSVGCTTVNKVCASGMKAVMYGAQSILCGNSKVVVVGGMESMSNTPYYLPKQRFGSKFGDQQISDGIVKDGLFDAKNQFLMGVAADQTAVEYNISRVEQDDFALSSYTRAQEATKSKMFVDEITPVVIADRKGAITVTEDEDIWTLLPDKLRTLKPSFGANGTVTAANASPLNDGACALVLASAKVVAELGLTPIAKIIGWADAAREPERFTVAPSLAIPKALAHAQVDANSIDYYELNEAFSVVGIANCKILGLPMEKVNVFGGSVALGHPLGCSGARIIGTLINVLNKKGGKRGVAAICNGGGGASAIVIELV